MEKVIDADEYRKPAEGILGRTIERTEKMTEKLSKGKIEIARKKGKGKKKAKRKGCGCK